MKYLNKKILLPALVFAVAFTSCKKTFLDVNDDPNRVTDQNVTPELIFTQAEVAAGDRAVGGSASAQGAVLPLQFAQNWIGYMAGNGDFSREYTQTSYNIDFSFGETLWQAYYNTLFDLHQAKTKALASGDTALAAASMILSTKLFQEVVDIYGNVPYTQAFNNDKYTHPAYDEAKDIYADLQKKLDSAVAYLQIPAKQAFKNADVIVARTFISEPEGLPYTRALWTKFANTLKLRLLIRQSEIPGFDASAEITKINTNGGVLGSGESISVNPGYANELNKQSPFYANYGYTATGVKALTSTNANAYIVDILSSTSDPRGERFFTKVSGSLVGDLYGDDPGNIPSGSSSSYFGPGLVGSATQDQWIMPSFESMFLQAEAIARGWMPGDAQSAYEAAVRESFNWLGVTDASNEADTYMANNSIADWSQAGSTASDQAKFIVFQKYIAMCCIDPLEAWADQRRLHFLPAGFISVNPSRISNTLPLRLLYPQSEYTTNSENVNAQGTINQFTSKLFWQP